jgi:hypothetical protein
MCDADDGINNQSSRAGQVSMEAQKWFSVRSDEVVVADSTPPVGVSIELW